MKSSVTIDDLPLEVRQRLRAQMAAENPARKGKREVNPGHMKYNPSIVATYFRDCGLPEPEFEHQFHPVRKWRLDVAWPEPYKVALEVQGGIFVQGRHSRGAAMLNEWVKLNALAVMGWRVLFCQPKDLCMSETVEIIRQALN